jgi:hypothetical protein
MASQERKEVLVQQAPTTVSQINMGMDIGSLIDPKTGEPFPAFSKEAFEFMWQHMVLVPNKEFMGNFRPGNCLREKKRPTSRCGMPIEDQYASSGITRQRHYFQKNMPILESEQEEYDAKYKAIWEAQTFEELWAAQCEAARWSHSRFREGLKQQALGADMKGIQLSIPYLDLCSFPETDSLVFGECELDNILLSRPNQYNFKTIEEYKEACTAYEQGVLSLCSVLGYAAQFACRRYPFFLPFRIWYALDVVTAVMNKTEYARVFEQYSLMYAMRDSCGDEAADLSGYGPSYESGLSSAVLFRRAPFIATIENNCSPNAFAVKLRALVSFFTDECFGNWDAIRDLPSVAPFRVSIVPMLQKLESMLPKDGKKRPARHLARTIAEAMRRMAQEYKVVLPRRQQQFRVIDGLRQVQYVPRNPRDVHDTRFGKMPKVNSGLRTAEPSSHQSWADASDAMSLVEYLRENGGNGFFTDWDKYAAPKISLDVEPVEVLLPPTTSTIADGKEIKEVIEPAALTRSVSHRDEDEAALLAALKITPTTAPKEVKTEVRKPHKSRSRRRRNKSGGCTNPECTITGCRGRACQQPKCTRCTIPDCRGGLCRKPLHSACSIPNCRGGACTSHLTKSRKSGCPPHCKYCQMAQTPRQTGQSV